MLKLIIEGKTHKDLVDKIMSTAAYYGGGYKEDERAPESDADSSLLMHPIDSLANGHPAPDNNVPAVTLPVGPPPPLPAAGSVATQLDVAGSPWDQRIHSSSRAKTAKGTWRIKRNLDKAMLAQVQAEIVQMVQPTAPAMPVTQPVAISPFELGKQPSTIEPVVHTPIIGPSIASQPVAPPVTPPVVGPPCYSLQSFKDNLFNVVSNLINDKKINQAYIEQLKGHFKVSEFWNVLNNEQQCAELFESFCENGLITRGED